MNEAFNNNFARSDAMDTSQLRPVEWSELVVRLAAMRDLRHSLSGESTRFGAQSGSQSCSAFTDFPEVREELAQETSEVNELTLNINPNALSDGKGPAPNNSFALNFVTPGDRELK